MRRNFRHKISSYLSSRPLLQDASWMSVVTRQTALAVLWLWLTRLKPMHSRKLNWTTITSKPQMIANFLPQIIGNCRLKVKVWTLAIPPLTWVRLVTSCALQSRKWQLIGMSQWCHSALCDHPLAALTDNWTHGTAGRHTIAPISHTRPSPRSRSYYSFPVPLRGRRLSWLEHTVG